MQLLASSEMFKHVGITLVAPELTVTIVVIMLFVEEIILEVNVVIWVHVLHSTGHVVRANFAMNRLEQSL